MITLSWQSLVSAAAALGALTALLSYLFKGYAFVKRQKEQDECIRSIREEQALLTCGILACLKGLKEQGCNGPVTEAIRKIEERLNEQAHAQR